MKKLIIILTLIMFISLSACQQINYDDKEISSIEYRNYNGYAMFESIKIYDLESYTYFESAKDYNGFIIENINIDLDPDEVDSFTSNIVETGIYKLRDKYSPTFNVTDSNNWYLTVNFTDGTTFKSQGYHVYPRIKDNIDEDFYKLSGYYLFKNNAVNSYYDRDDVYKLETITFANDGDSYGVKNLQYQFNEDDTLTNLFGIDENTKFLLIKTYYDYIRIWSMLSGEAIEEIDPDVVNPLYSDYYWLYIKRIVPETNCYAAYFNLLDVYMDYEVTLKINYLNCSFQDKCW